MAHIMLPNIAAASDKSNKAKFADTAVDVLLSEMMKLGAKRSNLVAKLAGGAHVFSTAGAGDILKVGLRNAAMAKEVLRNMKIPIRSEDVGGSYGRTIELLTDTGELRIKTIGHGVKTI
jgi:chemotaxis protein CheD